ncbi:MAG TPA: 16S rRNA (cytidine(1402)-2'-O)-methyltransferase [Geminicoccaceae bacterium]
MPPRRTSNQSPFSRRSGPEHESRPATGGRARPDETNDGHFGSKLAPGLYLVATPIGHLGDLSPRALETITLADIVLAEDTRVSRRLLGAGARARPLTAYHEHNAARVRPGVLKRLQEGASVALVSDAGTPLVSDPGYRLVQEAIPLGVAVTAVPGPSAALAALVVAGLPTDRFLVQGFLPPSGSARARAIAELAAIPATLVLFEAARRLPGTLADLAAGLGDRPAAVARELTKRFEEVRRGTLAVLAEAYAGEGPPKGEVVVVVGPPEPTAGEVADVAVDRALRAALEHLPAAAAAGVVAATSGRPRREIYKRALALKGR